MCTFCRKASAKEMTKREGEEKVSKHKTRVQKRFFNFHAFYLQNGVSSWLNRRLLQFLRRADQSEYRLSQVRQIDRQQVRIKHITTCKHFTDYSLGASLQIARELCATQTSQLHRSVEDKVSILLPNTSHTSLQRHALIIYAQILL